MDNTIEMVGRLKDDNQHLKREIKRLKLVNELNIVMFQDAQKKQNEVISVRTSELSQLKERAGECPSVLVGEKIMMYPANDE